MQFVVTESQQSAKYVVIWMHGLGASCYDMAGLAQAIAWPNEATRQIFLQAPDRPVTINHGMAMPAWYDIASEDFANRQDHQGVQQSCEQIQMVVSEQITKGIKAENIFLSGFSQGGAMALFTGLGLKHTLGGLIALSAYIPCVDRLTIKLDLTTPIFMGYGQLDPIVQPQWSKSTADYLAHHGFHDVTLKDYMMEHAVSPAEIADLQSWFSNKLVGDSE